MSDFNYKQWLQENKSGPYQKILLFESQDSRYGVIAKTKGHLLAYPDPNGAYTKAELDAWQAKGQEAGHSRKLDYVNSREEAMQADQDTMEEDTYNQTYNEDGEENPQPEDEQFSESMFDLYMQPGQTNTDIEHYSDAELNMDNDEMPDDYSVPNSGLGADRNASWKPKPFDNAKTSIRTLPSKYGW